MTLPSPRRSNCLVWALCMKHLFGGEIAWRKSHNWPGLHWYWVGDDGAWGYSPTRVMRPPWNLLWFRGRVSQEKAA